MLTSRFDSFKGAPPLDPSPSVVSESMERLTRSTSVKIKEELEVDDRVTGSDYGAFLPEMLKDKLINHMKKNHLPLFEAKLGCVMIADISGFTKVRSGEIMKECWNEATLAYRPPP